MRCLVTAALTMTGAFGQGFGAVLSRKAGSLVVEGVTVDGLTAAYQRVLGGLTMMAILLLLRNIKLRNGGSIQTEIPLRRASVRFVIVLIVLNALCGPTLGVGAYQWALNVDNLPAGIVLSVIALSPLVIIPLSMRFEGEKPSFRSVIGSVIAVAGVIIMTHQVAP